MNELPYTLNEFAVSDSNVICFAEKDKGWEKLTATMKLLEDHYNFYIDTDGCGYIYLHLETADYRDCGAPHYKWVSDEEDEYLESVRRDDELARATNKVAANRKGK